MVKGIFIILKENALKILCMVLILIQALSDNPFIRHNTQQQASRIARFVQNSDDVAWRKTVPAERLAPAT